MSWGLAIAGAVIGLSLAAGTAELFGAAAGALLGVVTANLIRLRRRLDELEARTEITSRTAEVPSTTPPQKAPARFPPRAASAEVSAWQAADTQAPAIPLPPRMPAAPPPPATGLENRIDSALRLARLWLTTGNVPVKIGVIVSFFGVAFLLKYAVDQRLFSFPIEMRLLSVAAAAMLLLAVGWRLRARARVYALSLQGGGLGILYLTTFAAFRLYELIPSPLAFALLVALTVAGGALAVLQDARGLATLGVVGGFLAPVLASTGVGNHVVLFSYYLVLNAMILA